MPCGFAFRDRYSLRMLFLFDIFTLKCGKGLAARRYGASSRATIESKRIVLGYCFVQRKEKKE